MKNKPIRQGDVIILDLAGEIEGEAAKDCVVALGEVTGHSHRIERGATKILFDPKKHAKIHKDVYKKLKAHWDDMFPGESYPFAEEEVEIQCFVKPHRDSAILKHDEHHEIELKGPQTRAVVIQRQYTPSGWKRVRD